MAIVDLVVQLLAGHRDLLGIDDDDEIACVDVRRELRLALAAERVRDAGRETAERLSLSVHEVPALLELLGLGGIGLHRTEKRRTPCPPRPDSSSVTPHSTERIRRGPRALRTARSTRPGRGREAGLRPPAPPLRLHPGRS